MKISVPTILKFTLLLGYWTATTLAAADYYIASAAALFLSTLLLKFLCARHV